MNIRGVSLIRQDSGDYFLLDDNDFKSGPPTPNAPKHQSEAKLQHAKEFSTQQINHALESSQNKSHAKPQAFTFSQTDIAKSARYRSKPIRFTTANMPSYYTDKNLKLPDHIKTLLSKSKLHTGNTHAPKK